MRKIVADIETDGLLPEMTKVHCLVLRDLETGEMLSCADQPGYPSIQEGLEVLGQAETVYFHNAVGFDEPALEKVYPEWYDQAEVEFMDTLVMVRLRFAHIKDTDFKLFNRGILPGNLIGSHKLEAWGYRLECWKGDYDGGWDEWSPAMQKYCEQDVIVGDRLVKHLVASGLPASAVELEHKLARYLRKQEENGWPFNVAKAAELQAELADRRQEIEADLVEKVGWWYGSKGVRTPKRSRTMRKNFEVPQSYYHVPRDEAPEVTIPGKDGPVTMKLRGQYTLLEEVTFNPASRQHIYTVLQRDYGWKPTVFTDKSGEPKVNETILSGLDNELAEDLVEYLMVNKRLGQLAEGNQAWLRHTEIHPETGLPHIHHRCWQGTRTGRQAHSSPNLGQVPKVGSDYGRECRELFHAPDGWTMLGSDVSGLELRTVAHYMSAWDGGDYGEAVMSGRKEDGTDVHTRNQMAVGAETRDDSKTWIYAYLYGAGDETLGRALLPAGASEAAAKKRGKESRKGIEKKVPALAYLTKAVKRVVNERGYVRLIDERRAFPRKTYSALNTLIQGTGAVLCKAWVVELAERLEEAFGPQGWDGRWAALGFIHDEVQIAVHPDIAEAAGEMAEEAIKVVGRRFSFNLPLDADYDIGPTWADTH